jgi:two-component system chemotaxis response regulator CheY
LIGTGELPQRGSTLPRCVWLIEGAAMNALRILIVDDSDTTRRILNTIVRSRHWSVCGEAESGWSGIKKFQELKPDLVLLDLAMPDINGIEVARMMSGLDRTVPIIMFTVLNLEGLERAAHNAGVSAIVSKGECWNLLSTIEAAVSASGRQIQ